MLEFQKGKKEKIFVKEKKILIFDRNIQI